jgi:hypothetical protein
MRSFILSLPAKLQRAVIIGSTVVSAFVISLVTRACHPLHGEGLTRDSVREASEPRRNDERIHKNVHKVGRFWASSGSMQQYAGIAHLA